MWPSQWAKCLMQSSSLPSHVVVHVNGSLGLSTAPWCNQHFYLSSMLSFTLFLMEDIFLLLLSVYSSHHRLLFTLSLSVFDLFHCLFCFCLFGLFFHFHLVHCYVLFGLFFFFFFPPIFIWFTALCCLVFFFLSTFIWFTALCCFCWWRTLVKSLQQKWQDKHMHKQMSCSALFGFFSSFSYGSLQIVGFIDKNQGLRKSLE